MRRVFVDTHYLIAVINPRDQWHQRAVEVRRELGATGLVVTDTVFVETLNFFAGYRPEVKQTALGVVRRFLRNPLVEVVEQAEATVHAGMDLYAMRLDKGYSLTDCISMNVMHERGINDILSYDRHFVQEGFHILL
jgi:uncharacterized protein